MKNSVCNHVQAAKFSLITTGSATSSFVAIFLLTLVESQQKWLQLLSSMPWLLRQQQFKFVEQKIRSSSSSKLNFQSLPHYVPWTKAKLHLVANWLLHTSWNWIFLSFLLMFLIEIWLLHCYLIGNSLQPYIYYQLRIITTVLFLAAMRTHFVSGSAELFFANWVYSFSSFLDIK
jgi:hypothetical protein